MSKVVIPVSVDIGASLEKIKSLEAFLLSLVPASNKVVNQIKSLKDSINSVESGNLGKVPDVFKKIVPTIDEVKKGFDNLAASVPQVNALEQAIAAATQGIIQFSQGAITFEEIAPLLGKLAQEAGGLDQGLALLKDLPNFDQFIQGLADGIDLVERFGEKALDINFDPNKTIEQSLRAARLNLRNVIAEFGALSPEAQQAAEAVKQLNQEVKDSKDLSNATDLEGKFNLAGKAIAGVASAFQTATALQAVFGTESKATEEALKKVQATMALTQGIAGVIEGVNSFKKLGIAIYNSNILMKIYQASTVVASVITSAFGVAVNATSLAFKGLAVAIASTGIGLIIVALGTLIPLLIKWISSNSQAEKSLNQLKAEEDALAESINKTNDAINDRNKALDFQTQKGVLLARIAGKTQEEINAIEEKGRIDAIENAKKDAKNAVTERINAEKKAQQLLETVKKKGSSKEKEEAQKTAKDLVEKAKKNETDKLNTVTALVQDNVLKTLAVQAKGAEDGRKQDEQNTQKAKDEAKRRGKELADAEAAANRVLVELSRRGASDAQQAIFKIQDEYAQKRKTLQKAGKGTTELDQAEAADILKVQQEANNQALLARDSYEKALFNVIVNGIKKRQELQKQAEEGIKTSRDLAFRAEISGVTDSYQKRLMEIQNAENKEMDELEKAYEDKKISLEKFLQDQAAIEAYYTNLRKGAQTDSNKKAEEELKAFQEKYTGILESGIEDATAALFTAIGAGEDPFAALSKQIGNSLADFAINLGKDLVTLGKLFAALKKALDGLGPAGKIAVGLALIAFGSVVKAAISKRSKQAQKGFATGGFVSGPGTETSDSIPARLSKGEYVIKARSVRKYGARTLEKLNKGEVPVAQMARAVDASRALVNRSEDPFIQKFRALVNRSEGIELFADGGLVGNSRSNSRALVNRREDPFIQKFRALVNRSEVIEKFSEGGLVMDSSRGTSRALVNRYAVPDIVPIDRSRAIVNRSETNINENFQREVPYIATTRVSGQDLKIILERADKRYSNAT